MGSEHNRLRRKWQDYGGNNAAEAEKDFLNTFKIVFADSEYAIRSKPKEFQSIYVNIALPTETLAEIYNPPEGIKRHGVYPDYAIDNIRTGKKLYVEVKRQDGWVEGGTRSDGRGNAHERSCKFFTPGLLSVLRKQSGIAEPHLPFWTVFQGDITRDPCRVREVSCWYQGFESHFFFWRNSPEPGALLDHFEELLAPLLD